MLQQTAVELGDAPDNGGLAEISQTKNIKFAFLFQDPNDPNRFIPFHPYIKCRDFLNDIVESKFRGCGFYIYGLEMEPEENKLDEGITRLALRFGNEKDTEHFIANFGFVLAQEKKYFDVTPSKLFRVNGKPKMLMVEADKYWQTATYLISLYSYMCRCVMYMSSPDDNWFGMANRGIDGEYMHRLKELGFEKVVAVLKKIELSKSPTPSGYPASWDLDNVHDDGGIISLMNNISYDSTQNEYAKQLKVLCA